MIDPRVLRTFLAICREGSISGAARVLNIAQPSVSVAIAQLEARLDTRLFERSRRGIVLTPAGKALRHSAERIEVVLDQARTGVDLAKAGIRGPLRIGGTPGALVTVVPRIVARLEGEGGLSLSIVERSDAQLEDLLRRGEIDAAVVTTGIQSPPPDIIERTVVRDSFALIVGALHAGLGPTVALRDVASWGWVMPLAAGAFHRQIEALFLAADAPLPTNVIRCDSLLTSKAIVRSGERITIMPREVVGEELASGALRAVPLASQTLGRGVGIRTMADAALSPLAARFIEACQEEQNRP